MAGASFVPLAGCLQNATERQTVYALSVLHLFKSSFVPTPSDPLSSYTAAEADYTTYVTKTLTAWFNPILSPGSGYMIQSPLVQWEVGATDPAVGNDIGGVYMLDAGGKLRNTVVFDTPVPMQVAGQGFPFSLVDFFLTGV